MVTFVLFPFIAGVIDSFIPNTPVMSPSILSALLLFFVNVQEMQIYSDALTGLNNRRRSDQVLESYIEKADTSGFYLFMIDVNRFKLINDRYGHDKGDLFLILREEGDFVWLADGKRRKIETPKKKRRKHVVSAGVWTHPVIGRLTDGEPVLDSEIRRALAAFRNRFSETKEV